MEPAELEHSRNILLALQSEVEKPLRNRDQIAVENPPDTIDRVQCAAERELAIRRIESSFNRLQSIRLALRRIDDGTYGTCIRCDAEISSKRLKAVPWASNCVTCQELADRENGQEDDREMLRMV
jgi:DnaK suppressor protein